jgi:ABC-type Fe3+-siderophore transport system permease subunit
MCRKECDVRIYPPAVELTMIKKLWLLFFTFAKIAALVLGGGLAMLPVIEETFVNRKKLLTEEELLDVVALTQTVPGIIAANAAVAIGMKVAGFAGALAALGLLLALPRRSGRIAVLLLAGIALNAFASAAMSGLLFMAGERLEGLVFWLLGGFWKLDWHSAALLLTVTAIILPVLLTVRREMNMLYLGEDAARHAGVDTRKVIAVAVVTSSLATAAVVASCGVIGFVGLLVPHIARTLFGGDFARHLAGSALIGAVLMIGRIVRRVR